MNAYSENVRHIDLFSGIGGFSLAVEAVWPNSEHIFCEIDPYCQALLKKRFERSVIFDDIRKFTADTYWNRLQEQGQEQGYDVQSGTIRWRVRPSSLLHPG